MKKGVFITLEGCEGSGKSTQVNLLKEKLKGLNYQVMVTKEPGGTVIGQKIREMLLNIENKKLDVKTELLLYTADRAQHLAEKIKPALESGKIVLSDRFVDSNIAYQGYGRSIDPEIILKINRWVIGDYWPDLTIILDIDVEKGLKRARKISKGKDRLEQEVVEFHKRVKEGYQKISQREDRIVMVKSDNEPEAINNRIFKIIKKRVLQ